MGRFAVSPGPVALLAACALGCSDPPAQNRTIDGGPSDAGIDANISDAAIIDGGLPDLTVALDRLRLDLAVQLREADECELDPSEDCVGGPGQRRLLHFAVETPNIGDGDLILGPPESSGDFTFSECHDHYHFNGYADYRLIDDKGGEVAAGRKQAFCLVDTRRYIDEPEVGFAPLYTCNYQGIQRGWSDVYHTRLPCQFIDITDVADGTYTLEVEVNSEGTIAELSTDNNVASLAIEIGGADLSTPTEPCPDDITPQRAVGLHRECGWTLAETFDCTPGAVVSVGCSANCGLGSCTGSAMLRVCDATRADGNCSYPAAADVGESQNLLADCPCDLSVNCPASGQIAVYTAPKLIGEAYTCDLAFEE